MANGMQAPEARWRFFEEIGDGVFGGVGTCKAVLDLAEASEPLRRASERELHMKASSFSRAPRERRHGTEGEEIARRVIERLGRKGLWQIAARAAGLGLVETRCRLDEGVEAPPRRPGTSVTIGAKLDIDDAGTKLRGLLGSEAARRHSTGAVALDENVGA